MFMYVGTYTRQNGTRKTSRGIYGLELDDATGQFAEPKLMIETKNPSFLAMNVLGDRLYAACDPGDFDGKPGGGVATFSVDPRTHALQQIGLQKSSEGGACHVSVSPDGRCVLTADYGRATVALMPTDASGIPQAALTAAHHGSGPNAERQKEAHAHSFHADPSGKFGLSCDLGTDEIYVYQLGVSPPSLTRHSTLKVTPGSGPRHLVFSSDRRLVYVVNELDSTVDTLHWNAEAGTLTHGDRVPMLPPDFKAYSKAAEIAIHPGGAFAYASNRGHDSLAHFHVDRDSGRLSVAGHTPTGGKETRHFAIAPGGKFLVAANQESDTVVAFRINAETGDLTPVGTPAAISKPVCVLFA